MIYVKMIGRLGNQLFYYAVARAIQIKNPQYGEIAIIPDDRVYDGWGGVQLVDFNVNVKQIVNKPSLSLSQVLLEKSFKVFRKTMSLFNDKFFEAITCAWQPKLNLSGIYCATGSCNMELLYNTKQKNIYISGVWENPYYFNEIRGLLLNEIRPNKPIMDHNRKLYNFIQSTTSVCISIRKGDFLKAGNEKFNICTEKYYYKATSILREKIGNYSLIVFSDDIEWCRQNLSFDMDVSYENNSGMDPVWEKIRLMSACKHFILSNSSFSWWAQYLGQFRDKVVIAPRPWRKNEYCDCLYDERFILLDGQTGDPVDKE